MTTKKIGAGLAFVAALALIAPSFASAATLYRSLDVGSKGADVTALQNFLAQDSTIYPSGRVTGYYGALTKAAVTNFQIRNGISAVGRVGPITMAALNLRMDGGMIVGGPDVSAPVIMGVSATAGVGANMTSTVTTNSGANTDIGYPYSNANAANNMTSTTTITTSSNTSTNSATVSWSTNEPAQGLVYYSTSPFMLTENMHAIGIIGSTNVASTNNGYSTYQRVAIPNLNGNTNYYYMIVATDQAGNFNITWPDTFRTR